MSGLRVIDASILPDIPSAATNLIVIMSPKSSPPATPRTPRSDVDAVVPPRHRGGVAVERTRSRREPVYVPSCAAPTEAAYVSSADRGSRSNNLRSALCSMPVPSRKPAAIAEYVPTSIGTW